MAHPDTNRDQATFWSDDAGPKWVALQEAMDAVMQPVLEGVIDRARLTPGAHVLDVGSGTGASLLHAAQAVGPNGHVTGADISTTMNALARSRAEAHDNITVLQADAATHAFDPDGMDAMISRFGVMFFDDPAAAFTNIARGLREGAAISMATWGQIPENPFFTLPAQVARGFIGAPPRSDPDAPGPFAFRDPIRILDVLTVAGFDDVHVDTRTILLTPAGDRADLAATMCKIGPAQAAIKYAEASPAQQQDLQALIHDALADYDTANGPRIPAQINFVTAKAGPSHDNLPQ